MNVIGEGFGGARRQGSFWVVWAVGEGIRIYSMWERRCNRQTGVHFKCFAPSLTACWCECVLQRGLKRRVSFSALRILPFYQARRKTTPSS